MKKTNIRKLTLNRETLMPLDVNDLENVQGGNIVRSAIQATKAASKWATRNICSALTFESAAETIRRTQGGNEGGK